MRFRMKSFWVIRQQNNQTLFTGYAVSAAAADTKSCKHNNDIYHTIEKKTRVVYFVVTRNDFEDVGIPSFHLCSGAEKYSNFQRTNTPTSFVHHCCINNLFSSTNIFFLLIKIIDMY